MPPVGSPNTSTRRYNPVAAHEEVTPPSTPTRDVALRAAQVIANVHATVAAAAATCEQKVADFVLHTTDVKAYATSTIGKASDEDAAQAAHVET